MARKGLTGQLNMFDLFKSLEDSPMGEVQMVSLMPEEESEAPEEMVEDIPQLHQARIKTPKSQEKSILKPKTDPAPLQETEPAPLQETEPAPLQETEPAPLQEMEPARPVMCRNYEIEGKQLEIAYVNYNKVRITREGEAPEIYVFDSSKEAVDYYVQKMQELEPEE